VRQSQSNLQYVPVPELWSGLCCGKFHDEVFGVIRGYIDESHDGKGTPKVFTLSCTLAHGGDWEFIETAWRWVLDEKNRELVAQRRKPLSRYHAVDCFNRSNEFEGWEKDERHRFVMRLFEIFRHFPTAHVTLTMSALDIREVWPENEGDPLHFAYYILLRLMMMTIGKNQYDLRVAGKTSLIYERCGKFGQSLLKGFNHMMDEPEFEYRHLFTTIAPMGWEDCIPLQPADLVAYEMFRDVKLQALGKNRSASLSALFGMPGFRSISTQVEKHHLIGVRNMQGSPMR
jgi:hypothetical protein